MGAVLVHTDPEELRFASGPIDLYGQLRHGGDGSPTLILLSGVGFHTFEYEGFGDALARQGFNALSFDFRGHGRSGGARGRWVLDDLVVDTRRAIDLVRERSAGPICLFGNSLGAMVAIRAAARDERVLGVVASNCPARVADFLLTRPRRALFAVAKLVPQVVPLRISLNHFYSYDDLIDDPPLVAAIKRDRSIADARRLSIATYSTLLEDWDGRSAVRALHKPLLLIHGRNDHFQPAEQSEQIFAAANHPKRHAALDTGHLPQLEQPKALAVLVAEWVQGLPPGSGPPSKPVVRPGGVESVGGA